MAVVQQQTDSWWEKKKRGKLKYVKGQENIFVT